MATKLPNGLVSKVPLIYPKTCPISPLSPRLVVVPTSILDCNVSKPYGKTKEVDLYVPQGADRVYQFDDTSSDPVFDNLSTVTFIVWDSISSGSTARITKSLDSGIVIVDVDKINVTLTGTDTNITPGIYWFEIWVTVIEGSRYLLKLGKFIIEDTRNND